MLGPISVPREGIKKLVFWAVPRIAEMFDGYSNSFPSQGEVGIWAFSPAALFYTEPVGGPMTNKCALVQTITFILVVTNLRPFPVSTHV